MVTNSPTRTSSSRPTWPKLYQTISPETGPTRSANQPTTLQRRPRRSETNSSNFSRSTARSWRACRTSIDRCPNISRSSRSAICVNRSLVKRTRQWHRRRQEVHLTLSVPWRRQTAIRIHRTTPTNHQKLGNMSSNNTVIKPHCPTTARESIILINILMSKTELES